MTGVSGSGKSTLVNEVLYKAVANRLHRAQAAAGAHGASPGSTSSTRSSTSTSRRSGARRARTRRRTSACSTRSATCSPRRRRRKARGYKPGRFSFNVKGGRCEVCKGDGQIKIEMHFLPDVYVPCEQCNGKRYNRETLEVRFKGKTIADVLEMPIEEALSFFEHIPKIRRRVQTLHDVGLDYMRLGQPATTLSGGEAQRVKLAVGAVQGRDRPDALHPRRADDRPALRRHPATARGAADGWWTPGNTVVVIEHNLDVIKAADRIIDLGPEGGDEGGFVMGAGTPEEIAGDARLGHRRLPARAAAGARAKTAGRRAAAVVARRLTPARRGADGCDACV